MDVATVAATGIKITEVALERSPLKLVPAGSIAFVVRSNVLRRRFPVALVPFAVTLNQDMRAVVPYDGILAEYLALVCRSKAGAILASAGRTDGSMAAIRSSALLDFRVPIPPVDVQREAVAVLNEFSSSQAELEAKLQAELDLRRQQYEHYRDALLAFEPRERERERVRWAALSEVGSLFRGKRFTKRDMVPAGAGVACIHYGEIYTHFGTATDTVISNVRSEVAPNLRFAAPGDVVIAEVGETVEEVGKAVAWLGTTPVAITDHSYAFRSELNPTYVSYCLQTPAFQRQKAMAVARTKVKTLLSDSLSRLTIPVPPREEQDRIVAILDKFDALVNNLSSGLPAEIRARRQQYEHYRDRLLSFDRAAA